MEVFHSLAEDSDHSTPPGGAQGASVPTNGTKRDSDASEVDPHGGAAGAGHGQGFVLNGDPVPAFGEVSAWGSRRETNPAAAADGHPQDQHGQGSCRWASELAQALWKGLGGGCNTSGWGASFEGLGWPDPAVGCPGSTSCVQAGSEPYAAGLG